MRLEADPGQGVFQAVYGLEGKEAHPSCRRKLFEQNAEHLGMEGGCLVIDDPRNSFKDGVKAVSDQGIL